MPASIQELQNQYHSIASMAERFNLSLRDELEELLKVNKISLGVPIEYRVKKLDSIVEKIERRALSPDNVTDLSDLIGLRLILLFSRDVLKTSELISRTFTVLSKEDTQERLGESQFGYQSFHYLIQLPQNWLSVPSFASVGQFKAEIQIRTVAQHIWAAASHVLQYKQESNVPFPVRRSIHRVSAILETVDLEFERVLEARESYISNIAANETQEPLNVDLLASALDSLLPPANKIEPEEYSELLPELLHFGIDSTEKLKQIIQEHLTTALKEDAELVEFFSGLTPLPPGYADRIAHGAFMTHVGLVRTVFHNAFGDQYKAFLDQRTRETSATPTNDAQAKPRRTRKSRGSQSSAKKC